MMIDLMQEDPEMARIRDYAPPMMRVYDMPAGPPKRRSFLWRLWSAWSPRQRGYRRAKLMPHPKPIAGLLWRAWHWLRYSKEHRAKPWRVEMVTDMESAMLYGEWHTDVTRAKAIEAQSARHVYPWLTAPDFPTMPNDRYLELNVTKPRRYLLRGGEFAGGTPSIECCTCNHVSYNANDIRERYCGRCHMYLDYDIPGRQREIREAVIRSLCETGLSKEDWDMMMIADNDKRQIRATLPPTSFSITNIRYVGPLAPPDGGLARRIWGIEPGRSTGASC